MMEQKTRWIWKQMPDSYNASYYNYKDYNLGRKFIIVDTVTGKEYRYPVIEKRKDKYGREYNQRVISNDLWNQDFMNWAASTSPDFCDCIGEEWMTPEMIDILIETVDSNKIFSIIPDNKLTQDICAKIFNKEPKSFSNIPDKYKTIDMAVEYVETKNPQYYNIPKELRTKEMFRTAFYHSDNREKLRLIKGVSRYFGIERDTDYITKDIAETALQLDIDIIKYIPDIFITSEDVNKAIDVNGKYIKFAPVQHITKEMAEKAFANNMIEAISFIPVQFQNIAMHKKLIDLNPTHINGIPEEALTDEIIYYTLAKKGTALGGIPEKRRTKEICEYALKVSSGALRHVPFKFKTFDMCLNAVISEPKLITAVPLEILNQDFIDALNKANVNIPLKSLNYVKGCLREHEKFNGIAATKVDDLKENNKELAEEYANIKLDEIPNLLSVQSLKILQSLKIYTVGDLVKESGQKGFIAKLGKGSTITEILGTVKLLRCKYLDEDPLIDENAEIKMIDLAQKLGFSVRTINCLNRKLYCEEENAGKEFFKIMRNEDRFNFLSDIRNMGQRGVEETISKVQIVLDYHDRHKTKEKFNNDNANEDKTLKTKPEEETLESLQQELAQIQLQIHNLTVRSTELLAKIQEKTLEQSKGGASK